MSQMDHVVGISWPRSGHHLLVRLLGLYFGDEFVYCDPYAEKPGCCGTIPCRHRHTVTFTKSHDFQLDVKQVKGLKYLVQYRQFTSSVVSDFELHVLHGGENSMRGFQRFASIEFDRYLAFLEKWVFSDFVAEQFLLDYERLVACPAAVLAEVVTYFAPGLVPDQKRIAWAVSVVDGEKVEDGKLTQKKGSGVHANRDVRHFRFYDPELFATLEKLTLPSHTVNAVFQRLLKRHANPDNMMGFQAFASIEALDQFIRRSEEYKQMNHSADTNSNS